MKKSPSALPSMETAFTDAVPTAQPNQTPPAPKPQQPQAQQPAPQAPPQAPPPQVQPPQQPIQVQPAAGNIGLIEMAAQLGYDVSGIQNERELFERMHSQTVEARQIAQRAAQQVYTRQPQQPQQPQQPAQPQQQDQDYWSQQWQAPQFDVDLLNFMERDGQTGRLVSKQVNGLPVVSQELVEQANRYAEWYSETPRRFFEGNPYKQIYDVIQKPLFEEFDKRVEERVAQILQARERESTISSFERENESRIYVLNGQGQRMVDASGNLALTPYGNALVNTMNDLYGRGIQDEAYCLELARKIVDPQFPVQQPGQQPPNGQPQQVQQPNGAPPQAQPFIQNALARHAQHSPPPSTGYAQPNAHHPQQPDERELDNLFVTAGNKAGLN